MSIDGAGIRGLIPLRIIDFLHQSITKIDSEIDVTSWVDVFASSSASSIFTGALMLKDETNKTKHNPKEILEFYKKRGDQIFSTNLGNDAENSIYPLNFILDHFFGNIKLRDLKNHFIFLCHNKTQNSLFQFSNSYDRFYDVSFAKALNACSAIPGTYPSVKIGNLDLCDTLNQFENPALIAYNHTKMLYPNEHIVLISIGAGNSFKKINQAKIVHEELQEIQEHDDKLLYFRFQPDLNNDLEFTTVNKKTTEKLIEIANQYIFDNFPKFEELLQLMALKAA